MANPINPGDIPPPLLMRKDARVGKQFELDDLCRDIAEDIIADLPVEQQDQANEVVDSQINKEFRKLDELNNPGIEQIIENCFERALRDLGIRS